MYRIGVDVGGTNTDAVVMAGRDILAAVKVPTSADVTQGLMQALRQVQSAAGISPADVALVVIGTTHFTNAVIERRHLSENRRRCGCACRRPSASSPWWTGRRICAQPSAITSIWRAAAWSSTARPLPPSTRPRSSRIGADIRARGIEGHRRRRRVLARQDRLRARSGGGCWRPPAPMRRSLCPPPSDSWACSSGRARPYSTARCWL